MKYLKDKNYHAYKGFIYIFFSLIFFELFLNFLTIKTFSWASMAINLTAILSLALIFYGFSKLFKERLSFIILSVLLFLTTLIYASQLIYYKVFRTFYTLYSALNSKQVLELKDTAIAATIDNIFLLVLLFIPLIIFLLLYKSFFQTKNLKISLIAIILAFIVHFAGVGALYLSPQESLSTYDFYFNNHEPESTVENLGLINYIGLDVKRTIFKEDLELVEKAPIIVEEPIIEDKAPIEDEEEEKELGYKCYGYRF